MVLYCNNLNLTQKIALSGVTPDGRDKPKEQIIEETKSTMRAQIGKWEETRTLDVATVANCFEFLATHSLIVTDPETAAVYYTQSTQYKLPEFAVATISRLIHRRLAEDLTTKYLPGAIREEGYFNLLRSPEMLHLIAEIRGGDPSEFDARAFVDTYIKGVQQSSIFTRGPA